MGCIASICAAAACSCCVGISCKCCGLMVTVSKSIATRVWYAGTFIIISLLAWILRTWGQDMFGWVGDCKDDSYDCGTLLAYKITFPLFLYHIILSLVLIGVKNTRDSRAQIQNGWWAIKIPALILMIVGSFFIPADFYNFYAWTCVIGAGIFILIQLVLLIDFAYDWSESWAGKYEENPEENKSYWWLLLCSALVLFLAVLGLDATMYGLFCFDNWYNPVVITLCLCTCLAITVLSILPKVQEFNPRLGLIQAGVVSLYCTYLIWSAILSEPLQVNLDSTLGQVIYWMSVVGGALFTVISVVYSSLRMGSTNSFATETLAVEEAKPRVVDEDDDLKKGTDEVPLLDDELPTDDELNGTTYNYSLFHIAFALGSMFVVMLLTNWSIVSGDNENIGTDMGWTSFGIKLGACVLGFLLYLWTIFAPAIFPDRTFH